MTPYNTNRCFSFRNAADIEMLIIKLFDFLYQQKVSLHNLERILLEFGGQLQKGLGVAVPI